MITIVASTNRPGSYTLKLAEYYLRKLQEHEQLAEILSLERLPEGLIHPQMYENHKVPSWAPIQELVSRTRKFIFIVPEYNGSFPGILKLFVDACKFPESFSGKKCAMIGVSTGRYGNIRGIDHFTGVANYVGLLVLPLKLHIPQIHKEFDEEGNLFKEDTLRYTNQQIKNFIAL